MVKEDTEVKILESAREVFFQKGFSGARMADIAGHAGINKALLHYYYRSKEKLFDAVFKEALSRFIPKVMKILNMDLPLDMKIYKVVDFYSNMLLRNPDIPVFVLSELKQNPEVAADFVIREQKFNIDKFVKQVQEEVDKGTIHPIEPVQLFTNIISMTIFPFIAQPIIKGVFDLDERGFEQFILKRKREIPDFLLRSIKK